MKNKEKIELLEKRIFCLEVSCDYAMRKEDEKFNEIVYKKPEVIEMPFKLDKYGDVVFKDKRINPDAFFNYLIDENIDQTQINRIQIEMKDERDYKAMNKDAQGNSSLSSVSPRIDWVELRNNFFNECATETREELGKKVNIAPHDLFEWFKREILEYVG